MSRDDSESETEYIGILEDIRMGIREATNLVGLANALKLKYSKGEKSGYFAATEEGRAIDYLRSFTLGPAQDNLAESALGNLNKEVHAELESKIQELGPKER